MSRKPQFGFAIVLLCLFGAAPAHAYRPFDGTDADVADAGEFEIEIGPAYAHEDGDHFLVLPAVVGNYGLFNDWELVVGGRNRVLLGASEAEPRYELSDPGAFVKGVLRRGSLQNRPGLSVAMEAGPLLPTRDESAFGASLASIFSERYSALSLHINVENVYTRSHAYSLFIGAILEGPDAWSVRPVLEVFGEREFGERDITTGLTESALAGLIWPVRDNLALDAGVRVARGAEPAEEVRAGFTWTVAAR